MHLCTLIRDAAPEFFSNNSAFEHLYDDAYADYSDFDFMVKALKDIHVETLLEDNSAGFYDALRHYGIPELPNEARWGDSIEQFLDMLLSCSNIPTGSSPVCAMTSTNCSDIIDAEYVEAV
jgi:hypothetical protein